ncbi:MAG: hypothetical protein IJG13_20725 [Kiritimatiellae bacterium]|nr:hypothetical protein [Kiritimatiellia bacterium]
MNVIKSGVAAAIASLCLAVQADNCTWTNFVANTPDTAYSWNNPGNRENGDVGGALSASAISGGGTVDGDLALSAGGGISLEIGADGTLPCFNVTGAADLSHGGTVAISGRFSDLQPGTYTILTSSSLSFGGEWNLVAETSSRTFSLAAVGDSLVVTVFKNGVILLVK